MKGMTTMAFKNFFVLLFVPWLLAAGCTPAPQNGAEDPAESQLRSSASDETIPTIETETVLPSLLASDITATGKVLIPEDQIAVIGPVQEGRLIKFYAGQGSRVVQGQRLADLESSDIDEAKADYLRALAELENARRVSESDIKLAQSTYDRTKLLYEKTIAPKKDLLSAERDLEVAKSNAQNSLASLQAGLQTARRRLLILGLSAESIDAFTQSPDLGATFTLISPIDGMVVERNATIGATVAADMDVFKIINLARVWVDADVFEKDLAQVQLNQLVKVTVFAYPGEVFSGKVIFISPLVDPETRTVKVRTEVPNPGGKLKLGMFADIHIQTRQNRSTLVVPQTAVLEDQGKDVVFVAANGGYEKREVVRGILSGDRLEILQGLASGDKVVVKGNYLLLEESKRQASGGKPLTR